MPSVPLAALPAVLSVSDLNRLARQLIEQALPLTWVAGEVSNFKRYESGHWYFTLKDPGAQIDCVMFRHKAQFLDWLPSNGMQVEVRACPTLYEARGKFQLNVEVMRRAGLGALYEAYARLKARLEREGLFDPARKRPLPRFPATVGIATSTQGAAVRDVLTTLARRMPGIRVIVYPTPVQGEGAAAKIAGAIALAGRRGECDVLVVCRGGGSIEDLWAYNEEPVARAIAACPIPVVCGIGHETDFTIADFAADARAPTPTAAAELVSPDRVELGRSVQHWQRRLQRVMERQLEDRMQRLDYLSRCLVHPGERVRHQLQHLEHLGNRLCGAWRRAFEAHVWEVRGIARQLTAAAPEVERLRARTEDAAKRLTGACRRRWESAAARVENARVHLAHLSPQQVLERGYAIAVAESGVVRDAARLRRGEALKLTFARGCATAEVRGTGDGEEGGDEPA
jgi:exodeoxyribonuclease VII large subunit